MKKNSTLWLSIIAAIAIVTIFFSNIRDFFDQKGSYNILDKENVINIEVLHSGKPFLLDFPQQTRFIQLINKAIPSIPVKEKQSFTFEKITVFLFGGKSYEITPLGVFSNDLIFLSPGLNNGKPLRDTSNGELLKLIESAYTSDT